MTSWKLKIVDYCHNFLHHCWIELLHVIKINSLFKHFNKTPWAAADLDISRKLLLSRGLVVSFRDLLDSVGFDVRVTATDSPLPGGIRDPLTIAISGDGLDFSAVGVIMTCTDTGYANSTCGSRNERGNNAGPSYPQGLTVVPPAPAGLQGLWVVATNNKEDVLVSHLAFSALPQTQLSTG